MVRRGGDVCKLAALVHITVQFTTVPCLRHCGTTSGANYDHNA